MITIHIHHIHIIKNSPITASNSWLSFILNPIYTLSMHYSEQLIANNEWSIITNMFFQKLTF